MIYLPKRRTFVIDTSAFTNPHGRPDKIKSTEEAVKHFINLAISCPHLSFYIPFSVKKELMHFMNDNLPEFEFVVTTKSPSLFEIKIPARLMHEFIDDVRDRINKGLRVAEEYIRKSGETTEEKIHALREKFRSAVRAGIVDSKEDFDVIMLALELKAIVITSDQGLQRMADLLGISFMDPLVFFQYLENENLSFQKYERF